MITTYTVNITPERIHAADKAIGLFLQTNPLADVEDALDVIFDTGIDAVIDSATTPNEVCL